ncbi:hypothetical protein KKF91_22100 [Myxococcota bacterium]|nr:hypothetical protein [Myxococcota bacterium]MBU1433235.1 hypothetical protein [Myxococcota bacterium]MBU1896634.1 hypothetical protein [Myxococcota bacterium]
MSFEVPPQGASLALELSNLIAVYPEVAAEALRAAEPRLLKTHLGLDDACEPFLFRGAPLSQKKSKAISRCFEINATRSFDPDLVLRLMAIHQVDEIIALVALIKCQFETYALSCFPQRETRQPAEGVSRAQHTRATLAVKNRRRCFQEPPLIINEIADFERLDVNAGLLIRLLRSEGFFADKRQHPNELLIEQISRVIEARLYLGPLFEGSPIQALVREGRVQPTPPLRAFSKDYARRREIFIEGGPGLRSEYLKMEQHYRGLLRDFEEKTFELEQRRIENANICGAFFSALGEDYLRVRELLLEQRALEIQLGLLDDGDAASPAQLEASAYDALKADHEAYMRQRLEQREIRLQDMFLPLIEGTPVSTAAKASYEQEVRQLTKEIALLAHPDRIKHHPDFARLTPAQLDLLRNAYQHAVQIRKSEQIARDPRNLNFSLRDVDVLRDNLARVKQVLEACGLPTDPTIEPVGETLAEKLEWLQREIKWLKQAIETTRLALKADLEDNQISRYQEALASPEKLAHARVRYAQEVVQLEAALAPMRRRWLEYIEAYEEKHA